MYGPETCLGEVFQTFCFFKLVQGRAFESNILERVIDTFSFEMFYILL